MSDLVERLQTDKYHSNEEAAEAAAQIVRLTAEVERLQAVVDAARAVCEDMIAELDGQVIVDYAAGAQDMVTMILRALDGEP